MDLTRSSGISPTLSLCAVVVGVVLALLAVGAPAASQAVRAHSMETSLATWESQLVLPAPIAARLEWAQRSMVPSGLLKLEHLARSLAPRIASGADLLTVQREAERGLDAVFSAAGLAGMDVSEVAFLVMAMATKDMDDDLRLIMAEIKATAAAKQKLRDQIRELEDRIAGETAKSGQTSTDLGRNTAGAARGVRPGATPVQAAAVAGRVMTQERAILPLLGWEYAKAPVIAPLPPRDPRVSAESMRSLLGDLKERLDGMNELSEMTSLRLQMTMDRRSKFIETLSNIMKKIGTTMETQVQNLK